MAQSDRPGPECLALAKRVRGVFNGEVVVDSRRVVMFRENARIPVYYFPAADVAEHLLRPSSYTTHCPSRGEARYWHVRVGEQRSDNAAWSYPDAGGDSAAIAGLVAFDWEALDAWYEEDEPVYVHPRDPYVRLNALPSSSRVEARLEGEAIACSQSAILLEETGLPPRWYLPMLDCRQDLLVASDTVTRCPYKGEARYYHLKLGDRLHEDIAWSYPFPLREVGPIAGRLCFYQERLEALLVDGQPLLQR